MKNTNPVSRCNTLLGRFHLPPIGFWCALLVMAAIVLMPAVEGLPVTGQRVLAILAFAVILWVTEAVSYEVSALWIIALMALLVGSVPQEDGSLYGTKKALSMAMGGFTSSGLVLVAAALFIAAAMRVSRLDQRIALITLSKLGTGYSRILLGTIVVTVILSLMVPSATARVACVVPIMMGIIETFGIRKDSRFAAGVMIMVATSTSIWNVGIQTAAAQNLVSADLIQKYTGHEVSWFNWLLAGAPWALVMSAVAFFVIRWMIPGEAVDLPGGKAEIKQRVAELGPMRREEKTLLVLTLVLLFLWATAGYLHPLDTATVTAAGLAFLLLPGVGVMSWKEAQSRIPWGTLVVFGVGISLGSALLATGAGRWLGETITTSMGLSELPPLWLFGALSLFLILVHIGFASATALTSTMMPVMLALLTAVGELTNIPGMAMLLGFAICFGFILPVNSPQNMVCIGTDTFTSREFIRIGIVITVSGFVLLMVFAATWWRWLGLL